MNNPETPDPENPEEEVNAEDALSELLGVGGGDDSGGGDDDLATLMGAMDSGQQSDDEVALLQEVLNGSEGNAVGEGLIGDDSGGSAPSGGGGSGGGPKLKGIEAGELKRILKLKVPFRVILAEKESMVRDIISLQVGSLIEFEKLSDELLDVFINDQVLGLGEVVKIHENFGVRVKEITSVEERIRKLGL